MARKISYEKIENITKEIETLQAQHKQLLKDYNVQEQKERTRRLCSRGGYLEKWLPETIALTENQYKVLLEKTLFSRKGREILDWLKDKNITAIETNAENQQRQFTLHNGEVHTM